MGLRRWRILRLWRIYSLIDYMLVLWGINSPKFLGYNCMGSLPSSLACCLSLTRKARAESKNYVALTWNKYYWVVAAWHGSGHMDRCEKLGKALRGRWAKGSRVAPKKCLIQPWVALLRFSCAQCFLTYSSRKEVKGQLVTVSFKVIASYVSEKTESRRISETNHSS